MVEIMAKETEKKKAEEAYFITTKELAEAGRDNICLLYTSDAADEL